MVLRGDSTRSAGAPPSAQPQASPPQLGGMLHRRTGTSTSAHRRKKKFLPPQKKVKNLQLGPIKSFFFVRFVGQDRSCRRHPKRVFVLYFACVYTELFNPQVHGQGISGAGEPFFFDPNPNPARLRPTHGVGDAGRGHNSPTPLNTYIVREWSCMLRSCAV